MVSQPCRFFINVSINNGKEIVSSCFDVVKIRLFFETAMLFVKKMRFLGENSYFPMLL